MLLFLSSIFSKLVLKPCYTVLVLKIESEFTQPSENVLKLHVGTFLARAALLVSQV